MKNWQLIIFISILAISVAGCNLVKNNALSRDSSKQLTTQTTQKNADTQKQQVSQDESKTVDQVMGDVDQELKDIDTEKDFPSLKNEDLGL